MGKLDFIYQRKSVRAFQATTISEEDLRQILAAATQAPSGKNIQNWHFVVIRSRQKIVEITKIVEDKNAQMAAFLTEEKARSFRGLLPYYTVFREAPVLVLAYGGPYPASDLQGCTEPRVMEAAKTAQMARPGIQNVAAAMENLLLAAAVLGYGGCWMTGPTFAAQEISACVGFAKEGYQLLAMTPLGVPANALGSPPRKALKEVVTFID